MKSFCFCKFLRNRLIVDVENVHIAAVNNSEMPNLIKEKLLQIISEPLKEKKKKKSQNTSGFLTSQSSSDWQNLFRLIRKS